MFAVWRLFVVCWLGPKERQAYARTVETNRSHVTGLLCPSETQLLAQRRQGRESALNLWRFHHHHYQFNEHYYFNQVSLFLCSTKITMRREKSSLSRCLLFKLRVKMHLCGKRNHTVAMVQLLPVCSGLSLLRGAAQCVVSLINWSTTVSEGQIHRRTQYIKWMWTQLDNPKYIFFCEVACDDLILRCNNNHPQATSITLVDPLGHLRRSYSM